MNSYTDLLAQGQTIIDLTNRNDLDELGRIADELYESKSAILPELHKHIRDKNTPLQSKVALLLLKSRAELLKIKKPTRIAVIYAMWGEQNRILPKSESNPNGEDSLRVKIEQLNWACRDTPVDWSLYVVDDGCPHGSGILAEEILKEHPDKHKVKVLFLNKAVPADSGPLRNLGSANDSRKGGAIVYGAMQAIDDGNQAIIYTDADNSVHLGQLGLLLEHYSEHRFNVVLGNRKDPSAVLVKQENRWGIGIKLLRHMQRMVGESIFSLGILDSQAAFKLYDAELLKDIISDPAVFDFSFDSDWIAASIMADEHFAKVPFAFIDSFAESASIVQGPMTTWETLLLGLVRVVEHRRLPHNNAMANVLKEEIQSSKDLDLLINVLPPELENAADKDLGDPTIMSPDQIKKWIQLQKVKMG